MAHDLLIPRALEANKRQVVSEKETKRPQPDQASSRQANPTQTAAVARRQRVEVAAYYNAQRRGFGGGSELTDWLEAERQIDGSAAQEGGPQEAADRSQARVDEAAGRNRAEFRDLGRTAAEHVDPDQVQHWAEELRVRPARLREAIKNVGRAVGDIRRFLALSGR